jgi:hypothetical protein
LLTAAIVALALGPSIGTGTAQARGFGGGFHGGFGGGFRGGFGRGFYGGFGGFYPGYYGWLFPVLLLLSLIACSLRPETAAWLAWTPDSAL